MASCVRLLQREPSTKERPEGPGLDRTMPRGVRVLRTARGPGLAEWASGRGYLNILSPKGASETTCIVYVHGGGFTKGSPDSSYLPFTASLAKASGLVTYVPDYTLVPFAHYPTQVEEILSTIAAARKVYRKIVLIGDSAGGTIALSVILQRPRSADRCALISPWINLDASQYDYAPRSLLHTSIRGCGDPVFGGDPKSLALESRKQAEVYLGSPTLFQESPSNPAKASLAQLRSLPPCLIIVGDREVLRTEILTFVARAQKVNKNITAQLYDGMWHVWPMYSEGCGGPPVRSAKVAREMVATYARTGRPSKPGPFLEASVGLMLNQRAGSRRRPSKPYRTRRARGSTSRARRRSVARRRTTQKN
jgi:monoterpene epsilon-lactone hydrolase